jgi:hypothetical protein
MMNVKRVMHLRTRRPDVSGDELYSCFGDGLMLPIILLTRTRHH